MNNSSVPKLLSVDGDVPVGRQEFPPLDIKLEVRLKGHRGATMIVSAQLKRAIDRYEILSFLEHLQFEADVTKLCRIGQPNLDIGSRRLTFEVENAIDKKMILKSAYRLKS